MNMFVSIFLFALATINVLGGQLLGGWSTSTDEQLKQECLEKALVYLRGGNVDSDLETQVTNTVLKTQIVHGVNIRLYFTLGQDKWKCSLFKSIDGSGEIDLEQCVQPDGEAQTATEETNNPGDDDDNEQVEVTESVNAQEQIQQDDSQIDTANQQARQEDAAADDDDNDDN